MTIELWFCARHNGTTPVNPELRRLRQEDCVQGQPELHSETLCLKKKKRKKKPKVQKPRLGMEYVLSNVSLGDLIIMQTLPL